MQCTAFAHVQLACVNVERVGVVPLVPCPSASLAVFTATALRPVYAPAFLGGRARPANRLSALNPAFMALVRLPIPVPVRPVGPVPLATSLFALRHALWVTATARDRTLPAPVVVLGLVPRAKPTIQISQRVRPPHPISTSLSVLWPYAWSSLGRLASFVIVANEQRKPKLMPPMWPSRTSRCWLRTAVCSSNAVWNAAVLPQPTFPLMTSSVFASRSIFADCVTALKQTILPPMLLNDRLVPVRDVGRAATVFGSPTNFDDVVVDFAYL